MICNRCKLKRQCRALREVTKEHFKWSVHNIIAHPLSEIFWLLGFKRMSDWLHEISIPKHKPNTGRG